METNEYIQMEERRFEILPRSMNIANKKIDRLKNEIEKITKEQRDIDMELDPLKQHPPSTTLADIPAVPWEIILKNFVIPKTVLSNLRLVSPALEEKFYREFGKSRMYFIGEAAFSILVQNLYLDSSDLRNCSRSKSDELGMWAAISSWYLEIPIFSKTRFPDTKAITKFTETANKKKRLRKVWEPFVGKVFSFDCRNLATYKDDYWRRAKEFLKNYGKYISTVEV